MKKEELFKERLETPFNITKYRSFEKDKIEHTMKKSSIIDWKEDYEHLSNQMEKNQIGGLAGCDSKQFERDKAKEVRERSKKENKEKEEARQREEKAQETSDKDVRSESEHSSDEIFIPPLQEPKSKFDIMGMI